MSKQQSSGINIDLGNHCSQIAFKWAQKTFNNRVIGSGRPCSDLVGAFSNIVDLNGVKLGISSDGIGTKIELAERISKYDTLGHDLVAMVADDLVANGIEPTNLSNILDVDFLNADIVNELMKGLHAACKTANIVITGGEIAELGSRIFGYGDNMHFNWCATGIGILPSNRNLIDGSKIAENDIIISLKSRGFRSNGFSLIRKIMQKNFGNLWHKQKYNDCKKWGEILLTPSLIYSPVITKLLKANYKINAIAHITGGGIFDNLGRILKKRKLGAFLDNLFPPKEFMRKVQSLGEIEEHAAYRMWNMGNGMLLVVDKNQAEHIVNFIDRESYQAKIAGKISSTNKLTLKSLGCKPQILLIVFHNAKNI